MIYVTRALPVNVDGQPKLTRQQVWKGLVLKADNALPFVPAMTECTVTARLGINVFDRDIVFRGASFSERITLQEPHRVVFTRTAGPVLGTILNEIEEENHELALRFSFAVVVLDVEPGSLEEKRYADDMTDDYLKAVDATLAAMRRIAAESEATL
ncbi:SRPBCC family protein [Streptomyces mirabilis]|uniref:SRPBCC family protein n=1 Tax=Streptomyces mirabilis TaxID=68239 RepID=UPI003316EFEB